MKEAGLALLV